jgi:hypothetical protein
LTSCLFGRKFDEMTRKLRLEYAGAIYHVRNRAGRREPIFETDPDRELFLDTLAETRRKTGWQGGAQKLKPDRRLRQETMMTLQWIANGLHIAAAGFLANLLRGAQIKQ